MWTLTWRAARLRVAEHPESCQHKQQHLSAWCHFTTKPSERHRQPEFNCCFRFLLEQLKTIN